MKRYTFFENKELYNAWWNSKTPGGPMQRRIPDEETKRYWHKQLRYTYNQLKSPSSIIVLRPGNSADDPVASMVTYFTGLGNFGFNSDIYVFPRHFKGLDSVQSDAMQHELGRYFPKLGDSEYHGESVIQGWDGIIQSIHAEYPKLTGVKTK